MKFSQFLNESTDSISLGKLHEFEGKDTIEGVGSYKKNDLLVVTDDLELDFGNPNSIKFSIAAVSAKDEDPVAHEVVAATLEVEFDIGGSKEDGPEFDVTSKAKITHKEIWELSKHDLDTYTNVKETSARFKKLLTDEVIRKAAQFAIDKNYDYVVKQMKKYYDKYND